MCLVSETKQAVAEVNQNYSVFDDILTDTIGYMDGFYALNDDLIFICTNPFETAFEIKKIIYTFNGLTRKASVEHFIYTSWGGLGYQDKYKDIKLKMDKIRYNNGDFKVRQYKRFIKQIKKSSFCDSRVDRILEEELKNG